MKDHIGVAKETGTDHINLAIASLLRRRAVIAQSACHVIPFHVFLHRHGCERGTGSKQVVTAAVAGRVSHNGATIRDSGLRESGQGVKFADNSDQRPGVTERGGERGGDSGDLSLNFEARVVGRVNP